MYERAATFVEYVKEYGLQRVEGVLLRYLSDAYKALAQTVPDADKTAELRDVEGWLGAVIKQVDSSLIEEWERLRNPDAVRRAIRGSDRLEDLEEDITRDERAFTVLVRNEAFRFVRHLARREWWRALDVLDPTPDPDVEPWTEQRLAALVEPVLAEQGEILTGPSARAPDCTRIEKTDDAWIVDQTLLDPDDSRDQRARFRVSLEKSREAQRPVLALDGVCAVG